jgi:hypothetical protein
MSHKPGQPANLDTPMTGVPKVPGLSSAPGTYNRHPNLGPDGVSGGLPLKTFDDAVKVQVGPTDNPMHVTPTKRTTS